MALRHPVLAVSLFVAVFALGSCGDGSDGGDGSDDPGQAYSVEISVTSDSGRIGALQLEIRHLGDQGSFIGRGDQLDCTPLVNAIVAGNSQGESVARIGLINLQGIPTPTQLLSCGFQTPDPLDAGDFEIEVSDASDTNSQVIDPAPNVVVSSVAPR